jgi:alpha-L-fucosidase
MGKYIEKENHKQKDKDKDTEYVKIVPSERQLRHQCLEFYAFFHFTVNTYTNKEWGSGTESPEIFNPVHMDADQWVSAIKAAGMKGAILTCKHHDGFCLWPSKYTEHSIKKSPYRNGNGDIVREVAEACRRRGLKFGVYLSPWDRNHPSYGYGKAYNDYFINQLEELLTCYGDIFCVWLDGACGEGNNGKKQSYDWQRIYDTVRRLQPGACITVCGPDIRWCGNEAGITRESEWSVVPEHLCLAEIIQENSQKEDSDEFRGREVRSSDQDLGSREKLSGADQLIWYPAEVNTSIRPGWFHHPEEDGQVKTAEELLQIYYGAVGGNSTFLLNIPPNREGLLPDRDIQVLQELGQQLRKRFEDNLMPRAELTVDCEDENHGIDQVRVDDYNEYYKAPDGQREALITVNFKQVECVSTLVLKENIKLSQRIEGYEIWVGIGGRLEKVQEGTVVGYQRIVLLDLILCDRIVIRITDSRVCPTLSFLGVYA